MPGLRQDNRILQSGIPWGKKVLPSGGFTTSTLGGFTTSRTGWMTTNIKDISNQVVQLQGLGLHGMITMAPLPEFRKFPHVSASLPASYRFSYCVPSGSPILK
jgi:hypothetical protein